MKSRPALSEANVYNLNVATNVNHRGTTRHLRAKSGQRSLITRPSKLFVNLLLVAYLFIFIYSKAFEKNRVSYVVSCFTYKCHTFYLTNNLSILDKNCPLRVV